MATIEPVAKSPLPVVQRRSQHDQHDRDEAADVQGRCRSRLIKHYKTSETREVLDSPNLQSTSLPALTVLR